MFHQMRNAHLQLTNEEIDEILERATSGVLALSGDDGYPYALPLSYCFMNDKIYFHSAIEGHKIDAIHRSDKASFCVIGADDVHGDDFTTHYTSVIAFGRIRILEGEEKREGIRALAKRYAPAGDDEKRENYIARAFHKFEVLCLDIEHMTGKQSRWVKQAKLNNSAPCARE